MALDETDLLKALGSDGAWIDAKYLADTLGVTTRTIRNYVRRINDASDKPVIESSHRGYRLTASQAPLSSSSDESRSDAILRRLVSAQEPISIYDLADELYVSESTVETDLRHVRDAVRLFDLTIERHRDTVSLEGSERDKRRLVGQMLISENPENFVAFAGSRIVGEGYNTAALTRTATSALKEFGLATDDYGLNAIVMHMVVLVERISKGGRMPESNDQPVGHDQPAWLAAQAICKRLERDYGIGIGNGDTAYLTLIIAANAQGTLSDTSGGRKIAKLVGEDHVELTRSVVHELEQAYLLPPFDDAFISRIAVHIHGLAQRIPHKVYAHNPLGTGVKEQYPLVYDMAVFLARRLEEEAGLRLNEDEISFLAFHLGSYLGQDDKWAKRLSLVFLYADYHGMHHAAIEKIRAMVGDLVEVRASYAVSEFDPEKVECDLLVTPVEVQAPGAGKVVVVSPLFGSRDVDAVRQAAAALRARKAGRQAYGIIQTFLSPKLFDKNLIVSDQKTMIETLAGRCAEQGLCDPSYAEEVLDREALSPTAFGDRFAVPHSMGAFTKKSFLYVVINEKPMNWGGIPVNIIMLMGVSSKDRNAFRVLFDNLLEVLGEPANVSRLIRSKDYEDFTDRLNDMIMNCG